MKFEIHFLRLKYEIVFGVIIIIKPLTSVKENVTQFHLVQGFCPLKINITQFPDGFRLNFILVSDLQ